MTCKHAQSSDNSSSSEFLKTEAHGYGHLFSQSTMHRLMLHCCIRSYNLCSSGWHFALVADHMLWCVYMASSVMMPCLLPCPDHVASALPCGFCTTMWLLRYHRASALPCGACITLYASLHSVRRKVRVPIHCCAGIGGLVQPFNGRQGCANWNALVLCMTIACAAP